MTGHYVVHDVFSPPTSILSPCGQRGCEIINPPAIMVIGEGSLAVSFPAGMNALGLRMVSVANNQLTFDFFRADGSLIDEVTVTTGAASPFVAYGFSREGGLADIGGFSVYSNSIGGFGPTELGYAGP